MIHAEAEQKRFEGEHKDHVASRIESLLMFAQYGVGPRHTALAPARHLLCPKSTLYSAGINNTRQSAPQWLEST